MKSSADTKSSTRDTILWIGVALITAVSFFATYYYNFTAPIKIIMWIGWLVISALLIFFTAKGQEVLEFASEAKVELQKVVWPNRQETVQTTTIVMIMVTVTGFILWGIDSAMMWIIAKITHLG